MGKKKGNQNKKDAPGSGSASGSGGGNGNKNNDQKDTGKSNEKNQSQPSTSKTQAKNKDVAATAQATDTQKSTNKENQNQEWKVKTKKSSGTLDGASQPKPTQAQQGGAGQKQQPALSGQQPLQQTNQPQSQLQGARSSQPQNSGHQQQSAWTEQRQYEQQGKSSYQPQTARPNQPQQAWSEQRSQGSGSGQRQYEQQGKSSYQPQTARPNQPQQGWSDQRSQDSGSGQRQYEQQGKSSYQPQTARPNQPQQGWSEQRSQGSGSGQRQYEQEGKSSYQPQTARPNQPQQGWSDQRSQGSGSGQRQYEQEGKYSYQPQTARPNQPQQGWSDQRRQGSGSGQRQYEQQGKSRYQQQTARSDWQQQRPSAQSRPQQQSGTPTAIMPIASSPERGTIGGKFYLETNYLILNLDKMPDTAYHYDVKIQLYNSDPKKIKEPPKKFLSLAFKAFAKQRLPKYELAYDGRASAYSADKLPEDVLNANEAALITAVVDEADEQNKEDVRSVQFQVTLKATDDIEVDLKSLKEYQKQRIFDKPMRALQCIEVVLRTPCQEKGVSGGRSYFPKPHTRIDLGDGYELWYGLYQAAMLCDVPLLNVDVSHKSFPSQVNLINLYNDNVRYRPEETLTDFLKGLNVVYHPPPCFKATSKRYKFNTVRRSSEQETVNLDGKKMTVAQYYQSKGYKLQFPKLPCLHVGSTVKTIYIPLELITVPAGQAILRKDSDTQVRNMIRHAATSTIVRKEKIMELLRCFEYYNHPVVERFGISVGKDFITIEARLLDRPKIEYRNARMIEISKPGEWNAQNVQFYETNKDSCKWAILNYSDKLKELKLNNTFVKLVISCSTKAGMNLANTCSQIKTCTEFNNMKETEIVKILEELKKLVGLVFVILPFRNPEMYSKVKQVAEMQCGVVTQCIKSDTIYKESRGGVFEINAMTMNNILLKVNAKINGINHKIAKQNTIKLQSTGSVMFVGADVSHPSPLQKDIPSIVGVVASHDEYGTQYNMQYRLQGPRVETIMDMEDIFKQHLYVYKSRMNKFPDTVIYYRDGVSDGQFKDIENIEMKAMKAACATMKCKPKFTCIIVVKRHHTRFFPFNQDAEGKFSNVKAGTVVDRTIIHPGEKQFFMVSHKSIQGTAKPTRYNVIVDESQIPINDLQTMTYNLCHLFPRCNRSVSYPAPAYLSHLVGLRGRAYIQGRPLNLEKLTDEYKKRRVCDAMGKNPMHFV